jgi:hypothetical protein
VTINGEVRVEGQLQPAGSVSALVNFWRSAENLSVNPIAPSYYGGAAIDQWAVSQTAPLRRAHIRGALFLFPHRGRVSSGGFLADWLIGGGGPSGLNGLVVNASQQQWLTRNSVIGSWSNGVLNQVFPGLVGAPPQSFPSPHLVTVSLGGVGTIEHVINDTGGTANPSNQVVDLVSYPREAVQPNVASFRS